jgi:hypothetical protein
MTRVSFLSHDIIKESPNVYPPYLYGGIGNLFPGYPPYPPETTGYWLHLTNRLTFTRCNVVTTRQLTNTARDRHCGQSRRLVGFTPPGQHMIWSRSVCYCLERWFLTRPVHRDAWIYVQSRRLDGRNPDNFKGTWLISDLMTASYPQFHRFFSHVNRLLRRRNTSPGHSLEFPSTRVNEWDRGFYTSREMTGRVCFSFRLSGISILAFTWPKNTK